MTHTVLLVDDNEADVNLLRFFLSQGANPPRVLIARDGEEGLQILRRSPPFDGMPRPDIVVLDVDLPQKSGRQVLAEIRNDPELRLIPVLIFTTCDSPGDIAAAYDLNANCCLTKPADVDEYARIVRSIEDFWLTVARLPSPDGPPTLDEHPTASQSRS